MTPCLPQALFNFLSSLPIGASQVESAFNGCLPYVSFKSEPQTALLIPTRGLDPKSRTRESSNGQRAFSQQGDGISLTPSTAGPANPVDVVLSILRRLGDELLENRVITNGIPRTESSPESGSSDFFGSYAGQDWN